MRLAFWRSQFQSLATDHRVWRLEATRLKHAADVLFERSSADLNKLTTERFSPNDLRDIELISPATLLYGLAVENLFKGLIIKDGESVIGNWRIRFGSGSGHDLIQLASKAFVSLNADETDLLHRLTRYVEWAGRYPVAKTPERMALHQKNVSPEWLPLPLQLNEVPLYNALFLRADGLLCA